MSFEGSLLYYHKVNRNYIARSSFLTNSFYDSVSSTFPRTMRAQTHVVRIRHARACINAHLYYIYETCYFNAKFFGISQNHLDQRCPVYTETESLIWHTSPFDLFYKSIPFTCIGRL